MSLHRADTIAQLKKDLLLRQGLKKPSGAWQPELGLSALSSHFPDGSFPLAAVHEFCCPEAENKAATTGFLCGLLAPLMQRSGAIVWITAKDSLFAPGLAFAGIKAEQVIVVTLPREKDRCWMMEEALKCDRLAAVIGELPSLGFTDSRRLQLAVEQSRVTGFVLRETQQLATTACVSRWRINPAPSMAEEGLPGIGFPTWQVSLLRMRNGRPGEWRLGWDNGRFFEIHQPITATALHRKAG